jgi:predicted dienelactone hydrolase
MKSGWRWLKNIKDMTRDSVEVLTRPRDISFAIDRAIEWNAEHSILEGRIDLNKIGVIGHSFGAYTTLVSCGARPALNWLKPRVEPGKGLGPDLSDTRVKACVALSPQGPGEPFFIETSYREINRPVFGITGSRDKQQESTADNRRRFFELLPPGDKYFLWLHNADHTAFSDVTGSRWRNLPSRTREQVQPIARAASLMFFNLVLKQQHAMRKLLTESTLQSLLKDDINALELLKK